MDQIRFFSETYILFRGGSVHAECSELVVADADSVTILIAAAGDRDLHNLNSYLSTSQRRFRLMA
jgi:hypothetical protein